MVYDKLANLEYYLPEIIKKEVMEFIWGITPDLPEEKYSILGEDVYASIQSYYTKADDECIIEAHNHYVDIQFTIEGEEGIDIFYRDNSKVISSDETKDFFTFSETTRLLKINNIPGYFTMIFPNEAHRPQEGIDGNCKLVKKGVIKVKNSIFVAEVEKKRLIK